MTESNLPTKKYHLGYLDSARGIAALMVMTGHYFGWKYGALMGVKIAGLLLKGSDSVCFFFVLSGFVLSYKYIVLNEPLDIKKFYINRWFRLWPAFFLTVLINALFVTSKDFSAKHLADVFIFNTTQFWEEASLIRRHLNYYLPSWSLVIELALSFFMPFGIAIAKKDKRIIPWMLLSYLLIGNNIGESYTFFLHFTLGILISCSFNYINDDSFMESKWYKYRYLIMVVSIILFSLRSINDISRFGPTYEYLSYIFVGVDFNHFSGLAAFVFIVAILRSARAQKILMHRFLVFIGKISYGIYLMHWVLVTAIYQNWDILVRWFPNEWVALFSIYVVYAAVTILLATILHSTIEVPFIKIGKRISSRLKPSVVIQ